MSGQTVRAALEELLRPLVPTKPKPWGIVRWQRDVGVIDRLTIVLKQSGIDPHPATPIARHLTRMTVTLVSPQEDPGAAEDELDLAVLDLMELLQQLPIQINVRTAEKVIYADRYVAYDITTEIDTEK